METSKLIQPSEAGRELESLSGNVDSIPGPYQPGDLKTDHFPSLSSHQNNESPADVKCYFAGFDGLPFSFTMS